MPVFEAKLLSVVVSPVLEVRVPCIEELEAKLRNAVGAGVSRISEATRVGADEM